MPSLAEQLERAALGRTVRISTRVGGGLGDALDPRQVQLRAANDLQRAGGMSMYSPDDPEAVEFAQNPAKRAQYVRYLDMNVNRYDPAYAKHIDRDAGDGVLHPKELFDESRMFPFYSSNVEGGYFIYYTDHGRLLPYGDLYLKFQSRKGDVPGGAPRGTPRFYLYEAVPGEIWQGLIMSTSSPGGYVWDILRRGGAGSQYTRI